MSIPMTGAGGEFPEKEDYEVGYHLVPGGIQSFSHPRQEPKSI
jgi:hypothetical protein